MEFCPKCNYKIAEENKFCPNCGHVLTQNRRKTGEPTAGGILLIIAAVFCFLFFLWVVSIGFVFSIDILGIIIIAIVEIFLILAFSIGLSRGIYTLNRVHFSKAKIGAYFVTATATFISIFLATVTQHAEYLIFGIVPMVLGILSIIFITTSKNEFTADK